MCEACLDLFESTLISSLDDLPSMAEILDKEKFDIYDLILTADKLSFLNFILTRRANIELIKEKIKDTEFNEEDYCTNISMLLSKIKFDWVQNYGRIKGNDIFNEFMNLLKADGFDIQIYNISSN